MGRRKYKNLFERLVANTRLAVEDDAASCWLWTGKHVRGYGRLNVWKGGRLVSMKAHRAMLEEFYDIVFPHDEAGHLCYEPSCINPAHLEVQTKVHNLAERRGMTCADVGGCWIPVLYPRAEYDYERMADEAWERPGLLGQDCPF